MSGWAHDPKSPIHIDDTHLVLAAIIKQNGGRLSFSTRDVKWGENFYLREQYDPETQTLTIVVD